MITISMNSLCNSLSPSSTRASSTAKKKEKEKVPRSCLLIYFPAAAEIYLISFSTSIRFDRHSRDRLLFYYCPRSHSHDTFPPPGRSNLFFSRRQERRLFRSPLCFSAICLGLQSEVRREPSPPPPSSSLFDAALL